MLQKKDLRIRNRFLKNVSVFCPVGVNGEFVGLLALTAHLGNFGALGRQPCF